MRLLKRTYSLPRDTLSKFEETVVPGKRSAVVATLLTDWIVERQRAALRQDIIEGCEAMAETYLEMEKEFHPLEEEVHRGFDA